MARFIIACPKGLVTGGPEALHQLAQAIADQGFVASLWDPDDKRNRATPSAEYDVYKTNWTEVRPSQGDVLIVPEVMSELVARYYLNCVIVFWWLSVDNFQRTSRISIEILRDTYPEVVHCYQSEYARTFLELHELGNSLALSDYINFDFSSVNNNWTSKAQYPNFVLAVNPAKGLDRTSRVLEKFSFGSVVKLQNMSRFEVIEALKSAHLYLDLGHHPGKDRIPREAALMNCVVVTNRRGSAENDVDIFINAEQFKIDDRLPNFESQTIEALYAISESVEESRKLQAGYRIAIVCESEKFIADVTNLIQVCNSNISRLAEPGVQTSNTITSCISNLMRERDAARQELNRKIMEKAQIENSLSWRLTAPLRIIDKKLRKLFR